MRSTARRAAQTGFRRRESSIAVRPPGMNFSALTGNAGDFIDVPATRCEHRADAFFEWHLERKRHGVWPFACTMKEAHAPSLHLVNVAGTGLTGLNFGSQDYLSLASDDRLKHAAIEALSRYGHHNAGSPMLHGNTVELRLLEEEIGEALSYAHVLLYGTGWAAGFGAVTGLVRKADHVVLDEYAHNCLVTGAESATPNVWKVRHLDLGSYEARLRRIRRIDPRAAILVATEGLFSMDADRPDLRRLQELCRSFDAMLLLDIAHDFGSTGPLGTGALGESGLLGDVDMVVGSFSKTFASNGGFIATNSPAVAQYLAAFSPTHVFSNALGPVQAAVVRMALRIVRSAEGDRRRQSVLAAADSLRGALDQRGVACLGLPSPIVPVPLGSEARARLAAAWCFEHGLFANLVEFPAVRRGEARIRMQCMADHTPEQAKAAAALVAQAGQAADGSVST